MKNIWTLLQIEPTSDTKIIRRAYAKLLQQTNPEVDPEGFQKLREAYESALDKATLAPREMQVSVAPLVSEIVEEAESVKSFIHKASAVLEAEPEPVLPEATAKALGMIEKLSKCEHASGMLALLTGWKREGIFNQFGISWRFQEELIDLFHGRAFLNVFLAAYMLFSWQDVMQTPTHPLALKLSHIIEQNQFTEVLALYEKTEGFPLHQAAITNDITAAEALLKETPTLLQEQDEEGNTPLHMACLANSTEFASFLIEQKALLEVQDNKGKTPLIVAIEEENVELIKLLSDAGANVNHQYGRNNCTPLFLSVALCNEEILEYLIRHPQIKEDSEALCIAIGTDKLEFVKCFAEAGYNLSPVGTRETPLACAAQFNRIEILQYLLDQGADPLQLTFHGSKAISIAAARGFPEIVKILAEKTPEDHCVTFAVHEAIKYNHFNVPKMLFDSKDLTSPLKILRFIGIAGQGSIHGFTSWIDEYYLHPEVQTSNFNPQTYTYSPLDINALPPIIQAIYRNDLGSLKQLLADGADPHETLSNGLAALHVAIHLHRNVHFDLLLQHGVDINQRAANFHLSPLFIAVKVQNRHAYRKLIDLRAQDLPTLSQHTALFPAVYNNDFAIVKELISRGSNLHQFATDGFRTLIYAAVRYQHHEMLKLLLSHGLNPDEAHDTPMPVYLKNMPELPTTALTLAIKNHDMESIDILLAAGANPERKSLGIPPLHFALGSTFFSTHETINYFDIVEASHAIIDLLLEYGVDIDAQSEDGRTFLMKVIWLGPRETTIHLIESGANLHIADKEGKLAIDHAREAKRTSLIPYIQQQMDRKN